MYHSHAIQWYLYSIDKLLLLVDSIIVPALVAPHSVSLASLQGLGLALGFWIREQRKIKRHY